MADVQSAFESASISCRRKRKPDDLGDDLLNHEAKRRSIHSLPFRLSPSRPQVSLPPAFPMFTSIYQQPPTPADTSDDESSGNSREEHGWAVKPYSGDFPGPKSDSSMSSNHAEYGDSADVDMDLTQGLDPPPKVRRARSNDIIAPYREPGLLSTMDSVNRERVPTPISGHFDARVNDLPSAPRYHFPPLRTNLSPMFEQESWMSRDGLPSPTEDQDMDMMLDYNNGAKAPQPHVPGTGARGFHLIEYETRTTGGSSSGRSRTAKLHMGFLQGCEKCIQKVPGHYSHILWT